VRTRALRPVLQLRRRCCAAGFFLTEAFFPCEIVNGLAGAARLGFFMTEGFFLRSGFPKDRAI